MIDIPYVTYTTKSGDTRTMSLTSRLLKDRIIMCTGEVTDELAESIVAQLLYLEAEDKKKPITMIVTGPGGSVTAGMSIITCMQTLSCPVHTVVSGMVASMSSMIAMAGEKGQRSAYPCSRYMLHTVSSGTQGKIQDMEISLNETRVINDMIFKLMAKCTGKKVEELKTTCDRDFWLSETEAIKFGVCDKVVTKHKA